MRTIKFRGFHADESGEAVIKLNGKEIRGEWYKGDLSTGGGYYIKEHSVIPETVGQYVCDDKKGKEVFEGDICKSRDNKNYLIKIGSFVPLEFYSIFGYEEQYIEKMAIYGVYAEREGQDFIIPERNSLIKLGNIHDNPELLEV